MSGRGKPAWAQVRLRVAWGGMPEVGDELRIVSSGRRYQVIDVAGRAVQCLVLPDDAPVQGRVIPWVWAKRARRGHTPSPERIPA